MSTCCFRTPHAASSALSTSSKSSLFAKYRTTFIPFVELFRYTDVLVSDGVYRTVLLALCGGVPKVLGGHTKDDERETRVKAAQAGVALNLACCFAEPLWSKEAVDTILANPNYRERVMQMSKSSKTLDAKSELVTPIEELACAE